MKKSYITKIPRPHLCPGFWPPAARRPYDFLPVTPDGNEEFPFTRPAPLIQRFIPYLRPSSCPPDYPH
ncbi:MAG: hypothetical protein JWL81_3213 [Verrucomicrobiales bacterium]|nr:hypothetical protein [Verrucomicrobiales bacterium]